MLTESSPHLLHAERLAPFLAKLRARAPAVMVALGDSNTCNTEFTAGAKQWPEILQSKLKERFGYQELMLVNAGICGDSVKDGNRRLERDVLRFQPDLVIVCFGTNDRHKLDEATFRKELRELCGRIESSGSALLLRTTIPIKETNPPPAHIWRSDHLLRARLDIVREVASELRYPLYDTYAAWREAEEAERLSMSSLMFDEVHANAAGHRLVAEQLMELFQAA